MTKSFVSLLIFLFLLLNAGGNLKFASGMNEASWCVAKPSASENDLNQDIKYACDILGDCKMIQPGGSCFYPDTPLNHASAVMNQYYAINGRNPWDCYFSGSALIVLTDPSYGSCQYA